jgi:hypothetical protein
MSMSIALADRQRLAIILGVWMVAVISAELTPTKELDTPNE